MTLMTVEELLYQLPPFVSYKNKMCRFSLAKTSDTFIIKYSNTKGPKEIFVSGKDLKKVAAKALESVKEYFPDEYQELNEVALGSFDKVLKFPTYDDLLINPIQLLLLEKLLNRLAVV